ncbi:MAG TPA: NACHT domain-containing protein, partial [Oculatellaceae cyanobacterium]
MSSSLQLCEEGIKIAQEAFRRKYPSQEALAKELSEAHKCEITRQPIARFLNGESISRQRFVWICQALDIDVNTVVKPLSESKIETTAIDYWHKICRDMLDAQKQNLRRQVTQMGFELNVYVPLGLVDRKQQSRRSSDFSLPPEQGSGFFQLSEEEIIKTYEHNEFLEQVIKQGQSKKSQGKRIAIIGEPGAGKTTLLEAIAFYKNLPYFPIWISLGSLGEKSLEEYLQQKWLKDALKTSDVTQQHKQLEELFKSGQVLLLLDGVDEMPAPSPVEALAKIREELTGWVADARVVLTCRVNVWDASVNALQGFDTYRTLEFSYGDGNKPDQVKQFICEWFSNTDKPKLGEPLRKKLDEDIHQRIRDLVKNPMRLSLLCQSWYFRQGDLPETKAALYEQFTRAFYDWKEEKFPTTLTKRKELNAALGLLAREAIDKEKSRFGIRESFALDVMGEDLFNLACKLHWLNFVYKDAENDEKVYAFFHPTFQEYFAALAIPDWDYFLKHVPHNPTQGTYRIFEQQWKEVIMLWLGREVDKEFRIQKEAFINALVEFQDKCGYFYSYKTYFLAAVGIAEFWECKRADSILTQVFKWGFGNHNGEGQKQHYLIENAARKVFEETDSSRSIHFLTQLISDTEEVTHTVQGVQFYLRSDADNTWDAARILIKINPGDQLGEWVITNAERLMLAIGLEKNEAMFLARGLPFQGEPIPINLEPTPESLDAIRAI